MNMAANLLQQPLIIALGWTLLHFLWQGAALAAIYAVLMLTLRSAAPATRYGAALGCLIMLALTPAATFVYFASSATPAVAPTGLSGSLLAAIPVQNTVSWAGVVDHGLRPYLPWLVLIWFAGVCIASVRMLSGWRRVRQLRVCIDPRLTDPWRHALDTLRHRMQISVPVQLASSTLIRIPMVIGWLKPIILIPPCVLAGLDSRQIEMILAHELAHIRRHDYLINLLQAVVETLLFYHPAVRWVSHQMRLEREKCCDRLVVDLSGDAIGYARALTNLEAIRGSELGWGLGASGGALYDRVQTLVAPRNNAASGSVAALLIAFAALIGTANLLRTPPHDAAAVMPAPIQRLIVPSRSQSPVQRNSDSLTTEKQSKPHQVRHQPTTPATSPGQAVKKTTAGISRPVAPATPTAAQSTDKQSVESAPQQAPPMPANQVEQTARQPDANVHTQPPVAAPIHKTSPVQQNIEKTEVKTTPPAPQAAAESHDAAADVPIEMPMPHYPTQALMAGDGATVIVSARVGNNGAVDNVSIVGPLDLFASAALAAVRQWRFAAGTIRTLQFRFVFSTNNGSSNCPTVTGTHICGTTLDAGDEIEGSIRVFAASPQVKGTR